MLLSFETTELPSGAVASAIAVFNTAPASTSAWVITYAASAVHTTDSPGARVVGSQVIVIEFAASSGSSTLTSVSVTLPSLVTVNEYQISSPASVRALPLTSTTSADLTSDAAGTCTAGTSAVSVSVTVSPSGSTPDTLAWLWTCPASTSAWVTTYDAVQVIDSVGARVAGWSGSHVNSEISPDPENEVSLITTSVNVTLPMLVAVKV